ncbi:MAG: hypothetical protein ABI467_10980, partial [Kofleriaceae bacterium]
MTDPKSPGKGGTHKPFLGDTEMSNELDAWDSMFDNLHGGPEAAATAGDEPVMEWPAPAPASKPNRAPDAALAAPDPAGEGVLDQTHLDLRAAPARATTFTKDPADVDPMETDFSEIGAAGPPSALGVFLGAAGPPSALGTTPAKRPTTHDGYDDAPQVVDEEDVYTSASRPNVAIGPDDADFAIDEPAPPPRPMPPVPPRRTGPAIIRRATPVAVPLANYAPQPSQVEEDSPFGENTRVADYHEMASARAEARSKAPTAPPPIALHETAPQPLIDEDDYADIEIGADASDAAAETTPPPEAAATPRRTAAHVVRRPEKSTKQPIVARERPSDAVVEVVERLTTDEPAGEDDFSDVAAAVGAEDDLAIAEMIPRRRPETPPGGSDIVPLRSPTPDDSSLDVALDEIVDADDDDAHETITMSVDDVLSEEDADEPVAAPTRLDVQRARTPTPSDDGSDDLDFGVEASEPESPPVEVEVESADPTRTLYGLGAVGMAARSQPQLETFDGAAAPRSGRQYARMQTPLPVGEEGSEVEPSFDFEAIQLPEQVQPLPSNQLDEDAARTLEILERELATVDETAASAALRIEAARLCERLGEIDRARAHYDAALLADPRATAALRGLRRIARACGDLIEATRQLDAELAVAGALERRPLAHYRIDLLLASGEQDLARVAVGEILDSAPSDVRSLLAQLELTFLDGRAEEFGGALEQLAHAVSDNELRAVVQSARGMLAAHHHDRAAAAVWFASAAESDPTSLGARLGAIRQAVGRIAESGLPRPGNAAEVQRGVDDGDSAASALLDLARQVETSDPATAAALALRAQHWTHSATAIAAARLATSAMPHEPLVLRIAAESATAAGDPVAAGIAFEAWAACEGATPTERSYAAARAAELDPARGAELWRAAITHDPGDDYAAQQLRTAHVAAEATQRSIDVDLEVAADGERERARLRAAFQLIGQGQLDAATDLLHKGHVDRPESLALTEALAEALAAAGDWSARAKLLAELAADPGERLDREVAQLRSALAWEEAVGAATEASSVDADELQRTTAAALDAWSRVLDGARGNSPAAHAAAIVLAQRLGDRDVVNEVLQRAQQAEASPWGAASLGLRRARAMLASGTDQADQHVRDATEAILRETSGLDDPRRTAWLVLAAARRSELGDAALALEERANLLGSTAEAGTLRLRAAQLALDAGDAARATTLLAQAERAFPQVGIIADLLAAARRRSGDRPTTRAHTPSGI